MLCVYVHHPGSIKVNQVMQRMSKARELFELGEGMKVGVVFDADFIPGLAILAFFGLTVSLRRAMLYPSNRAETL